MISRLTMAIAALGFSAASAHAACEVKHGGVVDVATNHPTNSHVETDCASAATVTNHEGRITALEATDPVPGPQGIQGIQGPQGDVGPKGDKGDTGETGAQGPQGIQGNQGNQGFQGIQGEKGDKGDKGDTGAQGIQGVAGIDGKDGENGKDGLDGKDGADGKDGKDYDPGELERGLATMGALNVPHVDIGKRLGVSGSAGFYESESAIGLGATIRFDDTWQFGGSIATGTSGSNVAGKAVITGQW